MRSPEYAVVSADLEQSFCQRLPAVEALPPVATSLSGRHDVEVYIGHALSQNPLVQAARMRVEAQANRVPQEASLEDPMIRAGGYPFNAYAPQTADGRMTVELELSQKIPWRRKLANKAAAAEQETDMARAELAAAELQVIAEVKRTYYELYYVEKSIEVAERERALALDLAAVAETKYRSGQGDQQDVLRAQLEALNLENELVRMRQELVSRQTDLARLLHVSPETRPAPLLDLAPEAAPRDLQALYEQATTNRPELHVQLAEIRRDHRLVELARLAYFPDFTASAMWGDMTTNRAMAPTAEGFDTVGLGLMANVPIYYKRLDAGVRQAEAQAVAAARKYDGKKDETAALVKDLFSQATSQEELAQMFRLEIIPKAEQTLEVSRRAYQAGEGDFLPMLENWRQLLRYELSYHRLEAQLRQTIAELEKTVGGKLKTAAATELPPDNSASRSLPRQTLTVK